MIETDKARSPHLSRPRTATSIRTSSRWRRSFPTSCSSTAVGCGTPTSIPRTSAATSATSTNANTSRASSPPDATKTKKLGFVAAKKFRKFSSTSTPSPSTLEMIDPAITVERHLHERLVQLGRGSRPRPTPLIDNGCDVITCHVDSPKVVVETAIKRRQAYVTGYHASQLPIAGDKYLTGAEWNWGTVYTGFVKDFQEGKKIPNMTRGGLKEGIVKMGPTERSVSDATKKKDEKVKDEFMAGKFDIFKGKAGRQCRQRRHPGRREGPNGPTLEKAPKKMEFTSSGASTESWQPTSRLRSRRSGLPPPPPLPRKARSRREDRILASQYEIVAEKARSRHEMAHEFARNPDDHDDGNGLLVDAVFAGLHPFTCGPPASRRSTRSASSPRSCVFGFGTTVGMAGDAQQGGSRLSSRPCAPLCRRACRPHRHRRRRGPGPRRRPRGGFGRSWPLSSASPMRRRHRHGCGRNGGGRPAHRHGPRRPPATIAASTRRSRACSLHTIAIAVFNYLIEGPLRDPAALNKPSTLADSDRVQDLEHVRLRGPLGARVRHRLLHRDLDPDVSHDLRLRGQHDRRQRASRSGSGLAGRTRLFDHDVPRQAAAAGPGRHGRGRRGRREEPTRRSSPATASRGFWCRSWPGTIRWRSSPWRSCSAASAPRPARCRCVTSRTTTPPSRFSPASCSSPSSPWKRFTVEIKFFWPAREARRAVPRTIFAERCLESRHHGQLLDRGWSDRDRRVRQRHPGRHADALREPRRVHHREIGTCEFGTRRNPRDGRHDRLRHQLLQGGSIGQSPFVDDLLRWIGVLVWLCPRRRRAGGGSRWHLSGRVIL